MKKLCIFLNVLLCLFIVGCNKKTELKEIIVEKSEIVLNIGDIETIEYELSPSDASVNLIWNSDNEKIAKVENGQVTALSEGFTNIIITCEENKEIKTTVKVTVVSRKYNITYILNDGIFNEDVINQYEENVGLDILPVPEKEGYEFVGWYLEDKHVTSIDSTTNKDITLVAKWNKLIKYYNITYILNDGIFNEDVINQYEENVGLDILPIPSKEGYEFDGWYLEDKLVTSIDSTTNKDITLVAKWNEVNKYYSITYVLNGGSFTEEVVKEYKSGVGLEILPIPVKEGYNFLGWFLNDNQISKIEPDYNKNIYLSARWEKIITESTKEAEKIIKLIDSLPYKVTYTDKEKINEVKVLYDQLDESTKVLVTNIDVLNEKIEFINEIENNTSEITYILGDDISLSKDELFTNFFADFYLYIKSYHGTSYLETQGIKNIDDFLKLASNFNAGSGNMTQIGHVAGRYMLKKDINGILENQPESGFFGYCYKNNKYVDLLPFFIRFFAYWRIDERYANTSNYGADMFAESWAPTVDIAKFFHYTNETTYVKTERMLDCFNFTSNVVYGDLPTKLVEGMKLPTDLKLRGYIFDGWYDNPEYNGDKIETITDNSKKVILYAKWIKDNDQIDKDNASMVDVYIYNLTTAQANVSKLTVSYVSKMYEALSPNAKKLVTKYNTLISFENKFKEQFLEPVSVTIKTSLEYPLDIESIKSSFMIDFNNITNSNLESFETLINSHYSYMKKVATFYSDPAMLGKWGYLLDILYTDDCAQGLKIQIERVKNNQLGDTEYVTKALGYLLLLSDATTDKDVLVDYSTEEVKERITNNFGTFSFVFNTESYLPIIDIDGYEFVGYFDDENNEVTKITEDSKNNLIAKYIKK